MRVLRRLPLKLVSIGLAALLWLIVSGEQVVERALRIPLEFTNMPAALELVGDTPTSVDVRVRGSSGELSRIAAGALVAVLDLREARPGQRLFHVGGGDVRAPFGIEVVQVTPSSVSMRFEVSASKDVPIAPEIEGTPAIGFTLGTVRAVPESIGIVGPASAVAMVTAATTEPVSIDGATASVAETVNVGVSDPSVRLRTAQSARVTVTIVKP